VLVQSLRSRIDEGNTCRIMWGLILGLGLCWGRFSDKVFTGRM
jgi:hypothetical protein